MGLRGRPVSSFRKGFFAFTRECFLIRVMNRFPLWIVLSFSKFSTAVENHVENLENFPEKAGKFLKTII